MLDKRIELEVGDKVQLRDLGGKILPLQFEFIDIPNEEGKPSKTQMRLKGPDGITLRAHRSRIGKIIKKQGQTEIIERTQIENPKDITPQITNNTQKTIKADPFDLQTWISQHGDIHMVKESPFDHSSFKLISHVCIDEENKMYHTINTYKYPDGTISLGKHGLGGNQYPLKGKTIAVTECSKEGNKQKRQKKGLKSVQEIIKVFEKKGYKLYKKMVENVHV